MNPMDINAILQSLMMGQQQPQAALGMGGGFGDMSGQMPINTPQPNAYGWQQLQALNAIDANEPQYQQNQPLPQNIPLQPMNQGMGGPQLAPLAVATNNNISATIQQQLGAIEPPKPNMAQDILSARFNNGASGGGGFNGLSGFGGPDTGDYAQGIISSALGKPMVGAQVQQTRMKDTLEQLALLGKYQKDANEASGLFAGTSMDAQTYNILSTNDPSSRAYKIAYNIANQPKTQIGGDGTISVVKPDLSAFAAPGATPGQPQAATNTTTNLPATSEKFKVGGADITRVPSKTTDIKRQNDLRDDYTKQSQSFVTQRDAYNRVVASAKDPSPAGDLSLIFNYMKVLDPGSTVREGEFATAQNAGGLDARIAAQYNKVLNGERLAPAMRSDFVNRSKSLYDVAANQQQQTMNTYSNLATQANVDPNSVAINLNSVNDQPANQPIDYREYFK